MDKEVKSALLCAALTVCVLLLTLPFLEAPVGDDFSYNETARVFAESGRFVYNGWATAMLGAQILWVVPVIQLWGFSFTLVRLAMLPFAGGCAFLLYLLARGSGLPGSMSAFFTLGIVLSPLFIAVAPTFHTDSPGLFFILLVAYACERALRAQPARAAIPWLTVAALAGVMGGTIRQMVWLAPLVMLPWVAWQRRQERPTLAACSALWIISLGAVTAIAMWFRAQPFALIPDLFSKIGQIFSSGGLLSLLADAISFALTICLYMLPLLCVLPALVRGGRGRPSFAAASIAGLLMLGMLVALVATDRLFPGSTPYWTTTVTARGINNWPIVGTAPEIVARPVRYLLLLCVLAATTGLVYWGVRHLIESRARRPIEQTPGHAKGQPAGSAHQQPSFLEGPSGLLAVFAAIYAPLIVLIARLETFPVDRYVLPMMPAIGLLVLAAYRSRRPVMPPLGWAALVLFAVFGVGATHDFFASARARAEATGDLRASGVPRDQILAGFDQDGLFQVQRFGYINDGRVRIPSVLHQSTAPRKLAVTNADHYRFMPSIRPRYYLTLERQSGLVDARRPVAYRAWFPPSRRFIYVQETPTRSPQLSRNGRQ